MKCPVIVSRHKEAVDFILTTKPELAGCPILAHADLSDVEGRDIYGNVPLHLAAAAKSVYAIEFTGAPPRGADFTLQEMRVAGAHLRQYSVAEIVHRFENR
jgi:Putative CRISPR-associated protein (Cas_VVA1548)